MLFSDHFVSLLKMCTKYRNLVYYPYVRTYTSTLNFSVWHVANQYAICYRLEISRPRSEPRDLFGGGGEGVLKCLKMLMLSFFLLMHLKIVLSFQFLGEVKNFSNWWPCLYMWSSHVQKFRKKYNFLLFPHFLEGSTRTTEYARN